MIDVPALECYNPAVRIIISKKDRKYLEMIAPHVGKWVALNKGKTKVTWVGDNLELLEKSMGKVSFDECVLVFEGREYPAISKYDIWAAEAQEEYLRGEAQVLETNKDIDNFINNLMNNEVNPN